jgi:hypothetical protein
MEWDTKFQQLCVGIHPRTFVNEVTSSLNVGEMFRPIKDSACTKSFRRKEIEFQEGKVHLLLFWITEADAC